MTGKRITVILYGSDRNLWGGGPLQIRVTDLFAAGGPRDLSQGKTEASTVELRLDLPFDAGQVYGLTFSAPRHRPDSHDGLDRAEQLLGDRGVDTETAEREAPGQPKHQVGAITAVDGLSW